MSKLNPDKGAEDSAGKKEMPDDLLSRTVGEQDAPQKEKKGKSAFSTWATSIWNALPWWLKIIGVFAVLITVSQLVCTSPDGDEPMPWEVDSTKTTVEMPESPAARTPERPQTPTPQQQPSSQNQFEMQYASVGGNLVNETSVTILQAGERFTLINERGEEIVVQAPSRTYNRNGQITSITVGETVYYADMQSVESLRGGSKPPHQNHSDYPTVNEIGYHIVRSGENASSIAAKYGMTLEELQHLNRVLCRGGDCSFLKAGQDKLKVYLNR